MSESCHIRAAETGEAELLSGIAQRSKAHWPYPPEFLEQIRPILTLTEEQVLSDTINVLVQGQVPAGWYRLTGAGPDGKLEDLWLEPAFIGGGNGRRLFEHALATARELGHLTLTIDSDPNAQGFYEAMGAEQIGTVLARSGRDLPLMRIQTGR